MADFTLITLITCLTFSALCAVYVFSKDPHRRKRAWRLLKLLLCRLCSVSI
jgi:hypothetical protein